MNIRSVTGFVSLNTPTDHAIIDEMGDILEAARASCEEHGVAVQTKRIATQPFAEWLPDPQALVEGGQQVEEAVRSAGIDYLALGPVRFADDTAFAHALRDLFEHTENVFASIEIANTSDGVDPARAHLAAGLIRAVSTIHPDGFANLKLAALARVGPWGPFFPAAYHAGGGPHLAVAMEAADLAVEAFSEAESLQEARNNLIERVEETAASIEEAMLNTLDGRNCVFTGIDFSLAPYPEQARSIGHALEQLGLRAFGEPGTLAAAAWLTDTLDRASFSYTGFNGLMLPVLEDTILAERAAEGVLHVRDLLIFSAVCGTGLDTIPLPGDISSGALTGLLMDVGALALRQGKPLTARLMPIPGKTAGDPISFDFEYFAPSRVMALEDAKPAPPLNGSERLHIAARPLDRRI